MKKSEITPCVKICRLDENKICTGCGRHRDEIQHWSKYSDEQKMLTIQMIEAIKRKRKNYNEKSN